MEKFRREEHRRDVQHHADALGEGDDPDLAVRLQQDPVRQREKVLDEEIHAQHEDEREGVAVGKTGLNEPRIKDRQKEHVGHGDEGDPPEEIRSRADDPADLPVVLFP